MPLFAPDRPITLAFRFRRSLLPRFWSRRIFGVFRPVLLVPEGIFEHLTPEQWKTVVAHELCHVRHRDNLVGCIQMFVETVLLVPSPGVVDRQPHLPGAGAGVRRRSVALWEVEPRTYAQGILKVCELYLESPVACVAGITGGASLQNENRRNHET